MKANEHGSYTIELEDNILFTDAVGPFNEQSIEHYNRDIKNAIESIKSKKWAQIVVLHEISLLTPDAEKVFRKRLEYRKKMGLCVICLITNSCLASSLVQKQFSSMYSDFDIKHSFKDSYEEAKDFVISQLDNTL